MIETGRIFTQEMIVSDSDTALSLGSGKLPVFATPAMVAFMENSALKCLDGMISENEDSVGIEINVQHLKATAVGKCVKCEAKIVDVQGRKVDFEIAVYEGEQEIGKAVHSRFIIDPVRFMNKL